MLIIHHLNHEVNVTILDLECKDDMPTDLLNPTVWKIMTVYSISVAYTR